LELSWTTFALEIINFLVLVWLLKHFLYRPVLDVIARRRANIDKSLKDAQAMQAEAEAMRGQYEGRLQAWERERQSARESLRKDIETERRTRLGELDAELASVQQRAQVADSRRLADARHTMETRALRQAAQFAARLLQQGAGPETHQRLLHLLLEELADLEAQAVDAIRHQFAQGETRAEISSAFPLEQGQREALEKALAAILPGEATLHYSVDSSLLAGLRITVGAWELGANIQDELRGFAELSAHA
jgi:F-type H+-transporting ATPase subunit b